VIDNAIRRAAIDNKVTIKLLISYWKHSRASINHFLKSLADISESLNGVDIQVKRFIVPSNEDQEKIPFARVNHAKVIF
jgi:phospholipase D3/4